MKLKWFDITEEWDGTFSINVSIDNSQKYTYSLASKFDVDRFLHQYNAGRHGRALTILNKYKISTIKETA